MSSLWTPGGEVPVDRNRPAEPPVDEPAPGAPEGAGPPDEEAMAAELARYLLEAPAAEVVAQHASGLYELAAIHLTQPEPKLTEARLAIDALAALVDGVGDRLGPAGEQLRSLLPQLQMVFVQVADRASGADDAGSTGD